MTRGEFDRELEQYLAQRRKAKSKLPSIFDWFKKPKRKMPETQLPPEIQKYDEGTPAEQPVETLAEEPEQPIQSQKGVFTKLLEGMGLITVEKQQPDMPQEEVQRMLADDDVTQDTKEIAKIALAVIKRLPPEQLADYKSSPEFGRLKELLKKHQLIK